MPAPKPIAQHKADGTYRADRHARRAAVEVGDGSQRLKPPPTLHKELRPLWRKVTATVDPRWLAGADAWLLVGLVEALHFQQQAAQMLVNLGTVIKTNAGDVHKAPHWMVWRQSVEVVRTLSGKLGLSPLDRARLAALVNLEDDDSGAAEAFRELLQRQVSDVVEVAEEW